MPIKTHLDEQPSINLTPMIDLVFNLMIFFMVATKFTEMERKVTLQVPTVTDRGALSAAPEKKIVNVYRTGKVTLDDRDVNLEQLTTHLAAARTQYKDLGVLVRGDAEGTFQTVADVLNACRQAGISRLAISVKLSTAER